MTKIYYCDICRKKMGIHIGSRMWNSNDNMNGAFLHSVEKDRDICFDCEGMLLKAMHDEVEKIRSLSSKKD